MEYARLVGVYEDLEATAATLEKRRIIAGFFDETDPALLSVVVKLVRGNLFAAWESDELGVSTSLAREAIAKATGISPDQIEDWWREEGDLGDAAAIAVDQRTQQALVSEPLDVERVQETLQALAAYEGEGSQSRRVDAIAGLISDADPSEARYIIRTVVGAMRLGVGDGIVRDAIAEAFLEGTEADLDAVQRAYEVTNDFATVATRARAGGREALADLDVQVFRPIQPMLAGKAEAMAEAMTDLADSGGRVLLEAKYDGIRAKLHHRAGDHRMFTRRLEDVTQQFPDVITAAAENLSGEEYIVEAEVVAFDPDTGAPVPFQDLSQRIKRKYEIERLTNEIPVTAYCFDLLYLDGESYLDVPLRERLGALDSILSPADQGIERAANRTTDDVAVANEFYEETVGAGHEGVMVKNLDAVYQPGSRVGYQLKVKSTMEPLDLVVTRAKWSEGRKSDFLGRPYLACRASDGSFKEVGRMHTGFTDADLEEFHELVEPLIQEVDGREAKLRPEIVLEVEYEEIQESPKYNSGYALRFPRFKRIRSDLDPRDADSFERVQQLYENQN